MLQLVLWALLIALCVVWFVRQAKSETNPSVGDLAGVTPKADWWMLAGFAVLIAGIILLEN